MARGRGRRDVHGIANGTLSDLVDLGLDPLPPVEVEDRRREVVEVSPIPRTRGGHRSKIVPASVARTHKGSRSRAFSMFNQMAFEQPRQVLVCVRRKTRREVILAKGKGGGKHRSPRRGPWSSIHCRRK